MMWPAIFPIAIRGLGERTASGAALMVMGICGGAVIPQIYSYYTKFIDFQTVFASIAIICYTIMGLYGIYGYFDLKRGKASRPVIINEGA